MRAASALCCVAMAIASPALAHAASAEESGDALGDAAGQAERELRQTFTNLQFEEFGPAPVRGPIYQAIAGGRVLYFAPESDHLLFAAIYDKNGVNITAMAQDASARKRLGAIDERDALVIGPVGAPKVIEFTDPDCPYCQALDRFWATKAAEGKPVQRLVYFVSGIHPDAAAKAEHILCSPDKAAAFRAIYAGASPPGLTKCKAGAEQVARHGATVRKMGISGTPTLFVDGKFVSGFQQAELEAFLNGKKGAAGADP
ncbi:protein-disulfide isomerase [Sphingopyxis sp. H038]|nr:protein-disulfide isomerase [Sphingopyxis sp. H012]KTE06025.1 protein-disulfide isomerase [Sphingopyxis sp. H053]KTE15644.1 protein-disulfide isomerase [Sphingopyxis sp. H093]KTE22342.1 protein-disulfide isomerase [Sphingopyxis sp. H080]KTE36618.1 protein-disulfide isomerase [Sphingopyxis sp. H038]KTE47342.1 protein-disulfide isomerase [Sphingopyxis sp. H005]KTE49057.1 protein-disulfide isomerase [Sphingopyxis sp. H077]KTE61707.1 protein-disulfide isomerase [Sphingopyxis sp. H085]